MNEKDWRDLADKLMQVANVAQAEFDETNNNDALDLYDDLIQARNTIIRLKG